MGRKRLLERLKMSSAVSSVSMSAVNIVICYLLIGRPEQMQTWTQLCGSSRVPFGNPK